jgi:hypothetical protein
MGQSYHALWYTSSGPLNTEHRIIVPKLKIKLYDIMGDVAREKGYHLNFVNGVEDRVHLLMCLHPTVTVAPSLARGFTPLVKILLESFWTGIARK